MENPIKMDDLGVPLFLETPIWFHLARCSRTELENEFYASCFFTLLGPKDHGPRAEENWKIFVKHTSTLTIFVFCVLVGWSKRSEEMVNIGEMK